MVKSFSSQARPSKQHTASMQREATAKITAGVSKRQPWMNQVDVTLDNLSASFRANRAFSPESIRKSVRGLKTVASQIAGQIASAEEHFATAIRLGCPQETVAAVVKQAEDLGMLRSKVAILLKLAQTSLAAEGDEDGGTVRLDETGYMVPPDDNPIDALPEGGGVGDDTKSFAEPGDLPGDHEDVFHLNGGGHRPPAPPADVRSSAPVDPSADPNADPNGDPDKDDLDLLNPDSPPGATPAPTASRKPTARQLTIPATAEGKRKLALRLLQAADGADADIQRTESDKAPVGKPNEQPRTPERNDDPWEPNTDQVSTSPAYQGQESDKSPVGTPPKKPDYDKNPDGYSQDDPSTKPPTSDVQPEQAGGSKSAKKVKAEASDFGDDSDPAEEPSSVQQTVGSKHDAADDDVDDDSDKNDDNLELPPGMDDSSVQAFFASEFASEDGDDSDDGDNDDNPFAGDDPTAAARQARRATASRQPGARARGEGDLLAQSINEDFLG